ncbi:hypothetical protein CsSME_00007729 [Camellia sinensis var. sinensis]
MQFWFILFASLCLCISLHSLLSLLHTKKLPPGPLTIPFLGNILWLLKSSQDFSNLEPILRRVRTKHGPILTLHIALFQNATIFANHPQAIKTTKVIFSNHRTVSSAAYRSLWKVLRQDFASVLHPSQLNKLEEKVIRDIKAVQRPVLANFIRFNVLNFMPRLGKIIRKKQEDVLVPLIRQCRRKINNTKEGDEGESILSEGEMLSLCSEFINGDTDTHTTTLQWVMANLVKHQEVQEKLYREISAMVKRGEEIKEQDLEKMPYLEAIVLETLRRHPLGHFILPRVNYSDLMEMWLVSLYQCMSNEMGFIYYFEGVTKMGWDPNVWEDPMEFRPERFMTEEGGQEEVVFDIKGAKEIKMMPFGAGKRVCPAITLALLHQKYFVANLVRDFKWTSEGDFTMVMKNPLHAHITLRMN